MAKLALVLDHMVSQQLAPPGGTAIRKYGHDLESLYRAANEAAQNRGWNLSAETPTSPFTERILSFLSRFAKTTRYANLDALASGTAVSEPLEEWNQILQDVLLTDSPSRKRERIAQDSAALGNLLKDATFVRAHDLASRSMTLEDWFAQPQLLDEAAKYVVWHLVLITVPLKEIVVYLSHLAADINRKQTRSIVHIPSMSEFYTFLWVNRGYVLRKKRWP
ncbi:MAG TPA: hypothetical protein VF584_02985 [Longimicrobium sp.]